MHSIFSWSFKLTWFFFFWKGTHFIFTLKQVKRWVSLVAQTVKSQPVVQEAWVSSLGWEDPLEEEMATYSSNFAWKIPWMEEPVRLQSMGLQRVRHDWVTNTHTHTHTHTSKEIYYSRNQNSPYLKDQAWANKTLLVLVIYSGLVSGSPGVCFHFFCQGFLNEAPRSSSLSQVIFHGRAF